MVSLVRMPVVKAGAVTVSSGPELIGVSLVHSEVLGWVRAAQVNWYAGSPTR